MKEGRLPPGFSASKPALLFHVLPLGRLRDRVEIGIEWRNHLLPNYGISYNARPNLEGGLVSNEPDDDRQVGIQYFRHGGFEIALLLSPFESDFVPNRKALNGPILQEEIASWTVSALNWLQRMQRQPPYVVFLSLVRVGPYGLDYTPGRGRYMWREGGSAFERDPVVFPEILISTFDGNCPPEMEELFQLFWQAAGWHEIPR